MKQTDVFVMTSFAEGLPVVLMEAMAGGVPVVATRIAGIPELVQDGILDCWFRRAIIMQRQAQFVRCLRMPPCEIALQLPDAKRYNRNLIFEMKVNGWPRL